MKNRMIINLLIACMIAAITLYVTDARESEKERERAVEEKSRLVPEADPEQFAHIEIIRKGAPKIVLAKENGSWYLKSPVNTRADLMPVNRLSEIVNMHSSSVYSKDEVTDLRRLGLWPANVILRLDDISIVIGTEIDPLSANRYVLYNDEIHLIPDNFYHFLVMGYPVFVNRLIVPNEKYIDGIETDKFIITRGDEEWRTTPKIGISAIEVLFRNWKGAFSSKVALYVERPSEEVFPLVLHLAGTSDKLVFQVAIQSDNIVLASKDLGVEYYLPIKLKNVLFPPF